MESKAKSFWPVLANELKNKPEPDQSKIDLLTLLTELSKPIILGKIPANFEFSANQLLFRIYPTFDNF